ncbi:MULTISPECIES: ScbR family autoregulator-binding transcription factor [unclassified Streptomyces]|uniref:ScbR family autoregulator-binding transcription factor n=1 Tax=unclassified Streptomyces TaxID=2593676 RepID=UPI0022555767|nr:MULTISPECIES: ScbR family autoregulator-binding transcription factor [unclassified Streptomyces]MCX5338455.1 ScbR family autoregulator-binding transcription factor [Streptomyces sp. NBC_00140]MCX5367461.1 ScbR family autoregulator-binding transcription factor [Streptomyces sp. NBC_00124]
MARQDRAIRTRQAILVAAAKVFDDVGYDAATISEILKGAGVTKGALYFHFTSKEELAQAVLAEQVRALPPVSVPPLKLQQAVDEALLLTQLLQKETGDPIIRGSVSLTTDPAVGAAGLDQKIPMQLWIDYSKSLFAEAKAAGELLPHVDLESIARLSVGAFTGVQMLSNIMENRADMMERVCDLYRFLLTATAVPAVLVQLDFSPERGAKVYESVMKERQAATEDTAMTA